MKRLLMVVLVTAAVLGLFFFSRWNSKPKEEAVEMPAVVEEEVGGKALDVPHEGKR